MAPVQNTFSIIPNLTSAINGNCYSDPDGSNIRTSRPPMTTKQVKKVYQKANKGPKLSKAEQRRQELFEQDRIRKEFEKEKNQARARAARDKKKEREERDRVEKKKKGLPLIDVRPSQDTIARFVRPKPKTQKDGIGSSLWEDGLGHRSVCVSPTARGAGKPRQSDGTDKENLQYPPKRSYTTPIDDSCGLCHTSPVTDNVEPPDKRRRVEGEEGQKSPPIANGGASPSPKHNSTTSIVSGHVLGISGSATKQGGLSVDHDLSTIDLSEENLLGDLFSEMDDVSGSLNVFEERLSGQQQDQNLPPKLSEDLVPYPKKASRPPVFDRAVDPTASMPHPNPVVSPKSILHATKTPRQNPTPKSAKQDLAPRYFGTAPTSQPFRQPRIDTAPPPALPKLSKQVITGRPSTSQFLKPSLPSSRIAAGGSRHAPIAQANQVRENELPPSTQVFLYSHLDDFFPNPSQETREILEDSQRKYTGSVSTTGLTTTYTSNHDFKSNQYMSTALTTLGKTNVDSTPFINPRGTHHIQQAADYSKPPNATIQTRVQPIPQCTPGAFEVPFFSTQDLLLSSQDVKDIEKEPLSSGKTQNHPPVPTTLYVKPHDASRRSPKQLFTSTCRELRYKYAMERIKTTAWEGPIARQRAREELDRLQVLEDDQLAALLVNRSEESNDGNIGATAVGWGLDVVGKRPFTTPVCRTPTPRVRPSPEPGSYSISDNTTHKHTRVLPDAQRPRLGSSGSSYEAMLELLAKAPKQNPDTHRGADGDGRADLGRAKASPAMVTIPASQETDYDGGEDWDDHELLCEMF